MLCRWTLSHIIRTETHISKSKTEYELRVVIVLACRASLTRLKSAQVFAIRVDGFGIGLPLDSAASNQAAIATSASATAS